MAVGIPGKDGGKGAVNFYKFNGFVWNLESVLKDPNPTLGDNFGSSVHFIQSGAAGNLASGDVLVVGAPNRDGKGAVITFEYDGSSMIQKSIVIDPSGNPNDRMGHQVQVHSNFLIVSSPDRNISTGEVLYYLYVGNGQYSSTPTRLPRLDANINHQFGLSMALDGLNLIVGSPGNERAYLYDLNNINANPLIIGPPLVNTGDKFGASVAYTNGQSLVGAPGSDSGTGRVYVYNGNDPIPTKSLQPLDLLVGERFGESLAAKGDQAVIGAPAPNSVGEGAAYFISGAAWNDILLGKDLISSAVDDNFGMAVSIDTNQAVVAAPEDGDNSMVGSISIFTNQ